MTGRAPRVDESTVALDARAFTVPTRPHGEPGVRRHLDMGRHDRICRGPGVGATAWVHLWAPRRGRVVIEASSPSWSRGRGASTSEAPGRRCAGGPELGRPARQHGDLGRRPRTVGPRGPATRPAPGPPSGAATTASRSTAREASAPSPTRGWRPSSAAGRAQGIPRVKMKLGREPDARDPARVARGAIGPDVELFVDANGAFDRTPALRWADIYAGHGVRYFEEPVSSDDLEGFALVRDRAPRACDRGRGVRLGPAVFRACSTRAPSTACRPMSPGAAAITGIPRAGALCEAHAVAVSAHCAPAASVHACARAPAARAP